MSIFIWLTFVNFYFVNLCLIFVGSFQLSSDSQDRNDHLGLISGQNGTFGCMGMFLLQSWRLSNIYAHFGCLKPQKKKFLTYKHQFSSALQCPARQISQISRLAGLFTAKQNQFQKKKILWNKTFKLSMKIHMRFLGTIFIHFYPLGTQWNVPFINFLLFFLRLLNIVFVYTCHVTKSYFEEKFACAQEYVKWQHLQVFESIKICHQINPVPHVIWSRGTERTLGHP